MLKVDGKHFGVVTEEALDAIRDDMDGYGGVHDHLAEVGIERTIDLEEDHRVYSAPLCIRL